jgi:hypothetical protein
MYPLSQFATGFTTTVQLITKRMKIDYLQWSICTTNYGYSPKELGGIVDANGTLVSLVSEL